MSIQTVGEITSTNSQFDFVWWAGKGFSISKLKTQTQRAREESTTKKKL